MVASKCEQITEQQRLGIRNKTKIKLNLVQYKENSDEKQTKEKKKTVGEPENNPEVDRPGC